MNKKLVLTGKAILSTVMASTMACSMLSMNIYAQEPEVVPEETEVVETETVEVPETVTEEATEETTTEDVIEEPEEEINDSTVVLPINKKATNTLADTPTTYSFPSVYDDSWTEQELRDEIQRLLNEAASLYEENKYRPSTENDYLSKKVTAEAALADTTLPKDKLAWQAYYMSNCIKAMNTAQNVLSESAKEIVIINKEVQTLNPSEYQIGPWEEFTSTLSKAISRINGNASKDYSSDLATIKTLYETALASKVDENLASLRDLVAECEEVIDAQKTDDALNYDSVSWRTFITALNEAKAEIEKGNVAIDASLYNQLYSTLENSKNALVPVSSEDSEGKETGVADYWTKSRTYGGHVYVAGEKMNGDGTTTLYINWVNDGINPVTGEKEKALDKSFISQHDNNLGIYAMVNRNDFGTSYNNWVKKFKELTSDEVMNGFTGYAITVNTGDKVIIGIGNREASFHGTFSAGVYQTKTPDTTAPEVSVKYSTTDNTEGPVTVTITANEPIQDIQGWTRVSENVLQKEYTENTKESIDVLDLAGNAQTIAVTVINIVESSESSDSSKPSGTQEDQNQETNTEKEDSKKTEGTDTGVFAGMGLFVGSATAAATGASVLAFLKKRKKD